MVTSVLGVLAVAISFWDIILVELPALKSAWLATCPFQRSSFLSMAVVVRTHGLGTTIARVGLRSPSSHSAFLRECLQWLEGLGRAGGIPDS